MSYSNEQRGTSNTPDYRLFFKVRCRALLQCTDQGPTSKVRCRALLQGTVQSSSLREDAGAVFKV